MRTNRNPFLKPYFEHIYYLESLYYGHQEYEKHRKEIEDAINKLIEEEINDANVASIKEVLAKTLYTKLNKIRANLNKYSKAEIALATKNLETLAALQGKAFPEPQLKPTNISKESAIKRALIIIKNLAINIGKGSIGAVDDIASAMTSAIGDVAGYVLAGAAIIGHFLNAHDSIHALRITGKKKEKEAIELDNLANLERLEELEKLEEQGNLDDTPIL